ncbi:hypothetical protein Cgig2_025644 [Carnegiea gigantea]|uniref:Uncharacterized protein n=1 Tax=Carnegiea gigantea TaxID=171969 RepID=A0A9Q1JV64_9CARY|nr:hypothetical protein Cgig2_025644 [Carnegiea gigantea]
MTNGCKEIFISRLGCDVLVKSTFGSTANCKSSSAAAVIEAYSLRTSLSILRTRSSFPLNFPPSVSHGDGKILRKALVELDYGGVRGFFHTDQRRLVIWFPALRFCHSYFHSRRPLLLGFRFDSGDGVPVRDVGGPGGAAGSTTEENVYVLSVESPWCFPVQSPPELTAADGEFPASVGDDELGCPRQSDPEVCRQESADVIGPIFF